MKRSEINAIMAQADDMMRRYGFALPPFAYWTPDEFKAKAGAARHVIDARCGWDITDYGAGDFDKMGLFLFTLRNGLLGDLTAGGGMCYAEKLLISRQDQLSPMHTHVIKAEDIINRGGATLVVELFGSDDAGNFAEDRGGQVMCDGILRDYAPGEKLSFAPGECVTLRPGDWHAFWGEGGDVLIGEGHSPHASFGQRLRDPALSDLHTLARRPFSSLDVFVAQATADGVVAAHTA